LKNLKDINKPIYKEEKLIEYDAAEGMILEIEKESIELLFE
jgi:hypothetical protein